MTAQWHVHGAKLDALRAEISGRLLGPRDDGYGEARKIRNEVIYRRPGLTVACTGTADVVAAARFATASDLEIAARGGGHNVAGNAVWAGGLMIDLASNARRVVDPERRIGAAQGGVTWRQVNWETQLHGPRGQFGADRRPASLSITSSAAEPSASYSSSFIISTRPGAPVMRS